MSSTGKTTSLSKGKRKSEETIKAAVTAAEGPENTVAADAPPPAMGDDGAIVEGTTNVGEETTGGARTYRPIFTSTEKGFELGENYRFKQRVFTFSEKPDPAILARLKESGFVYRGEERAWTISANAETRILSNRLAQEFTMVDRAAARR